MKQFVEDLKENVHELKNELRIIREDLKSHDKDIAFLKGRKYADSSSPLSLNADGLKVLNMLERCICEIFISMKNLRKKINKNWDYEKF